MLRVKGACLAFFQICVVLEVVVGLMADDSPLSPDAVGRCRCVTDDSIGG